MVRWLNHNRFRLYVCTVLVWYAVFFLWAPSATPRPSFLTFLCPVLILSTLFALSSVLMFKEADGTGARYLNQCDPQPMLDVCTAQFKESHTLPTARYMLILRTNRIAALSALGRTEEAVAEMDAFLLTIPAKNGKATQFTVLNRCNYVGLLLDQGRLDWAERELAPLADLLVSPDCPDKVRPFLARHLELHRCDLALQRGDFEGGLLEGRLLSLLDSAPYLSDRVHCAYQLGLYYLAANRRDEAMARFQSVADHGGTLGIRAKAKQFLLNGRDPER